MKKNLFLVSAFASLAIFSCVKHEVVPAPVPTVDLEAHFTGLINGTDVEYSEDVEGYNGTSSFVQYINSSSAEIDTTVYFSTMESDLVGPYITIGIGGISWDASSLSTPSLTQFTDFFTSKGPDADGNFPTINYSLEAKTGFQVTYKDKDGHVWKSSLKHDMNLFDSPVLPGGTPTFSDVKIESDNSGDYAKFTAKFGCELYRFVEYIINDVAPFDTLDRIYETITIEDGIFSGWIKR